VAELTDSQKATMYLVVGQCAERFGYQVDSHPAAPCLAVHGVVDPVAFVYEVGFRVGSFGSVIDENIQSTQVFPDGYNVSWPDLPAPGGK
jgi:hypothetical protein